MNATDKAVSGTATGKDLEVIFASNQNLTPNQEDLLIGCLLALYDRQTLDEQSNGTTVHQNMAGFNGVDAPILSDIAAYFRRTGGLSEKQLVFVRRKLAKYYRTQLINLDIRPQTNNWGRKKAPTTQGSGPSVRLHKTDPETLVIQFPYNTDLVTKIKTLSDRRWNGDYKVWTAPRTLENVEALKGWGFALSPDLAEWIRKQSGTTPPEGIEVPGLKMELMPFQKQGVGFLEKKNGRALIGDEMGLGKTAQAIAWVHLREAMPAVVVCPASVKRNWEREIHKWVDGSRVTVLVGRPNGSTPILPKKGWTILNYDILKDWVPILQELGIQTLIIDECHYIKNSKAQRTEAVTGLVKDARIPNVIGLSGTPIVNRPLEFFTMLNLLRKDVFPGFWKYAQKYCGAKHNGFGWDFTGASNTEELHTLATRTVMVRREKADVLKDLPPKRRVLETLPLDNRTEYESARDDLSKFADEYESREDKRSAGAEALVRIERLKQAAAKGKIAAAIGWIHDYLETEHKLVIFTTHHETIDTLQEALKQYNPVVIDGRVAPEKRQPLVDRFQEDPNCRVFLGNIKAAGIGINLTAANATCFVELGWTPGEHDQAEDRVHRIGQTADSVLAYYLLAERTIEEEIATLLDKKRRVLTAVLDGRTPEQESMLTELLALYKGKGRGEETKG